RPDRGSADQSQPALRAGSAPHVGSRGGDAGDGRCRVADLRQAATMSLQAAPALVAGFLVALDPAGAVVVVLGRPLHLSTGVSTILGAFACFTLRCVAIQRRWSLPTAADATRDEPPIRPATGTRP